MSDDSTPPVRDDGDFQRLVAATIRDLLERVRKLERWIEDRRRG